MSSALLFATLLAQSVWTGHIAGRHSRTLGSLPQVLDLASLPETARPTPDVVYQRHQFATSFNRLTQSLNEFADSYNQGTLDLKKIEQVKKAWRDLQKIEARFRLEKSK